MATFLSPEVLVRETDLTITTPGVATSTGAFVGEFTWGPVNDITQLSNEAVLVARFGKPTNSNFTSFYSAKNFLDYSNNLMLVRASTSGQLNAVSTGTAVKIGNQNQYDTSYANGEATVGMFAAKWPGALGNSLKVSMADAATYSKTLAGTVSVSLNSSTVLGSGTTFLTDVAVGSNIKTNVGGTLVTKQVTAIVSDTELTVNSNYSVGTPYSITSVTLVDGGSGYVEVPTVTFTGGGSGTDVTVAMELDTVVVAAGGTGYTNGDVLTLVAAGSGTQATLTVTNAVGGVIQAGGVSVTTTGTYSTILDVTAVAVSGGTGSNATFDLKFKVKTLALVDGGTGFTTASTVGFTVATPPTSVATATATVGKNGITGVVAEWEYADQFSAAPVNSNRAVDMGATGDGLHAVVIDEDGLFSGVPGTVLERFDNISKASDALRFDGTSGYYKTVLNTSSYIWWMDHPIPDDVTSTGSDFGAQITASADFKDLKKPRSVSLVEGSDGSAATDGELQIAYDLFKNVEQIDISLIITGKVSADVARYVIQNVAEYRKDAVAFVSPVDTAGSNAPIIGDTAESLEKIITYYNTMNVNSSYGVCDSGFKYQYDKYNDVYRWVPLNADVAGLCARTDSVAEPWYSPAGLNRGQVRNVTRLAYNPDKAARDELFKRNINPVVSFPGEGTVLFGDKTMMRRPSAFDAINVRRLFILLEKAVAAASKYYLFEQNTELTRQLFAGTISPLLRDIKGRQGITDFYVDVGPTVNTADTIDANELRANIFIKPVRAIRFISLNFIATRTSASFTEIEL